MFYRRHKKIQQDAVKTLLATGLFLLSIPLYANGITPAQIDLHDSGQCISFRFLLPQEARLPSPMQRVVHAYHRATVYEWEGNPQRVGRGNVPRLIITDGFEPDTPLLVPFPREMADELRSVLALNAGEALRDPGKFPLLRDLLGSEYFERVADAGASAKNIVKFPEHQALEVQLSEAQGALERIQAQAISKLSGRVPSDRPIVEGLHNSDPEVVRKLTPVVLADGLSPILLQDLYQAEAKVRRIHLLLTLRNFYETRQKSDLDVIAIDRVQSTIRELNRSLRAYVPDELRPVGQHPLIRNLPADGPFLVSRREWIGIFNDVNAKLPQQARYIEDPTPHRRVMDDRTFQQWSSENAQRSNRLLDLIRRAAELPIDLSIHDRITRLETLLSQVKIVKGKDITAVDIQAEKSTLRQHLVDQGFLSNENLVSCRRFVQIEQEVQTRLEALDNEYLQTLRGMTQTRVEGFVAQAQAKGIEVKDPKGWKEQVVAMQSLQKKILAELQAAYPRLFGEDSDDWLKSFCSERISRRLPKTSLERLIHLSLLGDEILLDVTTSLDVRNEPEQIQWVASLGKLLSVLKSHKRGILHAQKEGDVGTLARLAAEMVSSSEFPVTKDNVAGLIRHFVPEETVATLPDDPVDIERFINLSHSDQLILGVTQMLSSLGGASTPQGEKVRQVAAVVHDLIQAKSQMQHLIILEKFMQLYGLFHLSRELQQRVDEHKQIPLQPMSEGHSNLAEGVARGYLRKKFERWHPGIEVPEGTQTVLVWTHGMGTQRSRVFTLATAVGMSSSFGKNVYGVGVSGPRHGGPENIHTLKDLIEHLYRIHAYYKEKGLRVFSVARSAMGSYVMQLAVEHPDVMDGVIPYSHVLPPGYPRGGPDQIQVNALAMQSDTDLMARVQPQLLDYTLGLIRETNWFDRLAQEPDLRERLPPTLWMYGWLDQEYRGALDRIFDAHQDLIASGVRATALMFDSGQHQLFNPQDNQAFEVVRDVTRLFIERPQEFGLDLLRRVLDEANLDPRHVPPTARRRN